MNGSAAQHSRNRNCSTRRMQGVGGHHQKYGKTHSHAKAVVKSGIHCAQATPIIPANVLPTITFQG